MTGISGSGPFGAEAHIAWLGQPAQLSAVPACCDSGPGQCSKIEHQHLFDHTATGACCDGGVAGRCVPGSGATSFGAALSGASKSICVGSSSEGAIVCAIR
jgi:hypothetical protein